MAKSGESNDGTADCPFDFYRKWVTAPGAAQSDVESITRKSPGTVECPIEGIPLAKKARKCVDDATDARKGGS